MTELQRARTVTAVEQFEASLSLAQAAGNEVAQAALLGRLAIESVRRMQFVEAQEYGERALAGARASGDERAVARALDGLKLVTLSIGDLESFRSIIADLEALLRRLDDGLFLQHALAEHAVEAAARGQSSEVFALFDEAMRASIERPTTGWSSPSC